MVLKIFTFRISSTLQQLLSSAFFWTATTFVVRFLGFILVLPVILKRLPSEEIGLWYIFVNITGLAALVEMGFSPIISRFICYYSAGLQELPSLHALLLPAVQKPPNFAGIAGLIRMAKPLYAVFSWLVLFAMVLGAIWLKVKYNTTISKWHNAVAFFILALSSIWSMSGFFWSGILYGLNRVQQFQKIVLGALILNYGIVSVGLWMHWGLFSLVLGQVALSLYQREQTRLLCLQYCIGSAETVPLKITWSQLWPMTWRGGLMGVGICLSFGSLTLICAQIFDIVTTARYALSFQLVTMVASLANSWLSIKLPLISSLYAQGRFPEIKHLVFKRLSLQMLTYVSLSIAAFYIAPLILTHLKTQTTFMEPRLLALLMTVGGIDLFVNSLSSVVQCGNHFPFVRSKLINGVLTILLAFLFGKTSGLGFMICAPSVAQIIYNGWYIARWCWNDLSRPSQSSPQELLA